MSKSLDNAIALSDTGEACEMRMLDTKWAAAGGVARLDTLILEYDATDKQLCEIAHQAHTAGVTVVSRARPSDDWSIQ